MKKFFLKYKNPLLILAVFILALALRIHGMNTYPFGWDQVNNAWAAKNIIINHEFPLVGMVAKQNTGFFIGPLYYYFVAIFYWLTNLNPIASQYVGLITSIFTFFTIYFVVKKIFSFKVALLACFINSIIFLGFSFDGVQWPVSFLPGISLLIFYFLYKVMSGDEKYVFALAITTGLSFHIHFTAVFFPIIILFSLPFFPRTKKMLIYLLLSIPLGAIWFMPNMLYQLRENSQLGNLSNYLGTNYHGFHLKRFFQIMGDGLIQFDPYLYFKFLKPFKLLIIPLFIVAYLWKNRLKEKVLLPYLVVLFFLIPWLAFSTYKGEISDYYFSINRFIALFIVSYLFLKMLFFKNWVLRTIILGFFIYYSYLNLNEIINYRYDLDGLSYKMKKVTSNIKVGQKIGFTEGNSESYIYYYLMREKGIKVY
jgi:4-amino-4-deoxy-L-arabinose transferase-like glycosyltransferase